MRNVVFESTRPVSFAEYEEIMWDRDQRGVPGKCELLEGTVVAMPPGTHPHGEVSCNVLRVLSDFIFDRKLGVAMSADQGFRFDERVVVQPDFSFVSRERWDAGPRPVEGEFLRCVPDLVVEVLSDTTAPYDRGGKKALYERYGVREYWLVDSRARHLTVFLLGELGYDRGAVLAADQTWHSVVLDGLAVDVCALLPD